MNKHPFLWGNAHNPRAQTQELFQTTVGPLRSCVLTYDARGQFKGTATVHFRKAEHATKAYTEYNKRVVDGSGS